MWLSDQDVHVKVNVAVSQTALNKYTLHIYIIFTYLYRKELFIGPLSSPVLNIPAKKNNHKHPIMQKINNICLPQ